MKGRLKAKLGWLGVFHSVRRVRPLENEREKKGEEEAVMLLEMGREHRLGESFEDYTAATSWRGSFCKKRS